MITNIVNLKPRNKRKDLLIELRRQIIAGQFKAGERFPSYEQLEKSVAVSKATLQYTVGQLQSDGYLNGIERKGLFIPQNLPCFTRFSLLFQTHEKDNKFWQKLSRAGAELSSHGEININNCRYLDNPEHSSWTQLQDDINALRVGGLIFTFSPAGEKQIRLENNLSIPKVAFTDKKEVNPSVIPLYNDNHEMIKMVLEYFRDRHIKRAAIITMGKQPSENSFVELSGKFGLETSSAMIQSVPREYPEYAANIIELLLSLPASQRPQGILINDDNLLEHAIRGFVNSKISAESLQIISHANFPDNFVAPVPIRRVGFNVEELMRLSVARLQEWHRNGNINPIVIKPQWETSK